MLAQPSLGPPPQAESFLPPKHPNFEALREYIKDYFALDQEDIAALRQGRYAPTHSLAWAPSYDEHCGELDPLTLLHACGYMHRDRA